MTEIDRRSLLESTAVMAAALALPAAIAWPAPAVALSLKAGTWRANIDGDEGDLVIRGADRAGIILAGSTLLGDAISGFWHEPSGRISFVSIAGNDLDKGDSLGRSFTGLATPGGSTMAGTVLVMGAAAAARGRSVLGWYAHFRGS
jgi:hypothetical protein